jgi:phosphoglycolate phosphatase
MPLAVRAALRAAGRRRWHRRRPLGYELGVGYRLVIFDLDGTLADSLPWLRGALGELADRFGFRRPDAGVLQALRRSTPREAMALLGVPRWKIPFIAARARRLMAREVEAIRPFAGVEEVLGALQAAGLTLALVTSNSRRNAERVLGPAAARISHWACGAALLGKAALFRRVLARSGIPAGEAIAVGDELRDGQAARAAGVAFGAVAWGYHELAALREERPAEVFERVEDLLRLAPARGGVAGELPEAAARPPERRSSR